MNFGDISAGREIAQAKFEAFPFSWKVKNGLATSLFNLESRGLLAVLVETQMSVCTCADSRQSPAPIMLFPGSQGVKSQSQFALSLHHPPRQTFSPLPHHPASHQGSRPCLGPHEVPCEHGQKLREHGEPRDQQLRQFRSDGTGRITRQCMGGILLRKSMWGNQQKISWFRTSCLSPVYIM